MDPSAKLIPTLEAHRAWQELESMTGRWGNTLGSVRMINAGCMRNAICDVSFIASCTGRICPALSRTISAIRMRSLLLSSGVPLLSCVAATLGHTNPTTTCGTMPAGFRREISVMSTC